MRTASPGSLVAEPATADGPPRRRASWNLRTIVEDVAGRPIEELQDPDRPPHPYLKGRLAPTPLPSRTPSGGAPKYDPVAHVYPPFVGAAGRAYHGAEHEHDPETLERHRTPEGSRSPGPSRRPSASISTICSSTWTGSATRRSSTCAPRSRRRWDVGPLRPPG